MTIYNKTVLITGASSGIGEACAHAFAKLGARLIISSRSESKLVLLKLQLEKMYHVAVAVLPMDVSIRENVERAILDLPTEWQLIDVLINNAGLSLGLEKISEANLDDWDCMIDTNIKGLLYVTHHVIKGMLARNSGHVINIGSISGYTVYSGGVVYCATKFAVRAISEGLKMDVHGTPIRVTEIDPGMAITEFSNVRFKGDRERADAVYKGVEPLKASDIADAIVYAVQCPAHVDIRQMTLTCTDQTNISMVHRRDTITE